MSAIIVSSCPGKVLLAGGYLVLDKCNPGLVIATSARMRSSLKWETGVHTEKGRISVYSKGRSEMYSFEYDATGTVESVGDSPENAFVEAAVRCALLWVHRYIYAVLQGSVPLRILNLIVDADKAFHRPGDAESDTPVKTGIGSSAALTASLVSVMLTHFYTTDPINLLMVTEKNDAHLLLPADAAMKPEQLRGDIHFVAQCAHTIAQGKVGSGFDICCAVYGSGIYQRYDPRVFAKCSFGVNAQPSKQLIAAFDHFREGGPEHLESPLESEENENEATVSEVDEECHVHADVPRAPIESKADDEDVEAKLREESQIRSKIEEINLEDREEQEVESAGSTDTDDKETRMPDESQGVMQNASRDKASEAQGPTHDGL